MSYKVIFLHLLMCGPCVDCRDTTDEDLLCFCCRAQLAEQRWGFDAGLYMTHEFHYEPLSWNSWADFTTPPPPEINVMWEQAISNLKGGRPGGGRDLRDLVAIGGAALFALAVFIFAPAHL